MDIWTSVLLALGGQTILLGIVAFLARSVIRAWLAKDLEKFKVELKSTSDTAIERLKADLQRTAFEHQVRFSKLHEKRAEVIAQMDKYLAEAQLITASFVVGTKFHDDPNRREEYVQAINKVAECCRFLDQHRIYLPESLCNNLEKFITDLQMPTIKLHVYERIENPNEDNRKRLREAFLKALESVEEAVPAARRALPQEFRQILGDDSNLKHPAQSSPTA